MACACQKYGNRVVRFYGSRIKDKVQKKKKEYITFKEMGLVILDRLFVFVVGVIFLPLMIGYIMYKRIFKRENLLKVTDFLNFIRFRNARRQRNIQNKN